MYGSYAWICSPRRWRNVPKYTIFIAIIFFYATADSEWKKDRQFIWKSGPWGRCIGDCGPSGLESRSVWCVHEEGWITHNTNCKAKDKPESQRNCFKICDWHRDLFHWEVTQWQTCVLVPYPHQEKGKHLECVTAQHGLQHRRVDCVQKMNRSIVPGEICEHFTPRPPMEQACLIPCPQDCMVSEFSHWSTCVNSCVKRLQHRTRAVISPPLYGGSECPNLTESRTCEFQSFCSFGNEEYTYSLKVGPWSKCQLPHFKEMNVSGRTVLDFSSDSVEINRYKKEVYKVQQHNSAWDIDIGYQNRHVRCTRSDGRNALLSICKQDSMPLHFQACIIPNDCEVTEWSAWGLCSKTCRSGDMVPGFRSRSRKVKHIAIGGGRPCPELEEIEACIMGREHLPLCPGIAWKTSEWMACQLSADHQDSQISSKKAACGGGTQTRKVFCVQYFTESGTETLKEVYRPVDERFCVGPMPPVSQLCNILCSTDCLLTPWSAWGPCTHENCLDPQGRKGFKSRKRNIIVEPMGPEGNCSHLVESIPCDDPMCYNWVISGELHCVPENLECGHGKYQLNTSCENQDGKMVSDELCVDNPPVQLVCKVPCSQDCVISEWSDWSPCSHSCSAKNTEGKQSRIRSILANPGEGGKPCPPSQALYEYRLCNDHPCSTFYWEVTPWGTCTADPLITTLNTSTVSWKGDSANRVGIQSRKVFCVKSNVGFITSNRCPEATKPETIRPCLLPCKKDCIVTLFSEWTPCPTSCLPGNATSVKQSRYRTVIQDAEYGGQECPDTLYEERECEDIPICLNYRWKTNQWSPCVLVPDSVRQGTVGGSEACGTGLQSTEVTCITDDGRAMDMTSCLKWAGPVPHLVQECHIPCKDDCTFTPWSKFTPCSSDCTLSRTRKRSLTGRSKKRDKCQDAEVYLLFESEMCPCETFQSHPYGNWSDCIIPKAEREQPLGMSKAGAVRQCGEGLRFKANACYDSGGRIVDTTLCDSSGYIEESCVIACPFDCKLSDWSAWSPCSSSCGTGVKIRSKWLKEKPYNGGRPCPKLDIKNQVYEAVPCYNECSQYSWVAEPWSACKLNTEERSAACGHGIQIRKVRCVNVSSEGQNAPVNDTYCHGSQTAPTIQECSLPCPGECVMSNWGHWTECTKCDISNMRVRSRFPLRIPINGHKCPEVTQKEPCRLNSNCFHYHYNITEWSTCQLSGDAVCGEGLKTRLLDCIRSNGKSVQTSLCEQVNLEKPSPMSIRCLVECAIDCQLSEWSDWSHCSQTCGIGGKMVRSRRILLQAQGEGRPCPKQLSQYKYCLIHPCYAWNFDEWSKCKIESGQCGEGLRFRNVTCMVHDASESGVSKQVNAVLCGALPSGENQMVAPCYVPCPGDCHLTEWSQWSACELICIDGRGFESVGRQSRSRTFIIQSLENQESCPEQVIETRPCKGGKCYTCAWKTSAWRDNRRSVWCQRSDGLNVTGGCSIASQPAAVRHCDPPCRKPFSICKQNSLCGCEQGYTEIMRSNGLLDYCLRVPGMEGKKADVKSYVAKNKPLNSQIQEIFSGWSIEPFDPDGRVRLWVYGVSAGSFLVIILIILISYLICKKPKEQISLFPQQKPLSFTYDRDYDM
ncbi:thrombospondin type-1 domain-containing protein 7B isoform X2 [Xenopus laevis]|uniref:Thrombospondin type-1 domain-containing protein 7A n=2 Tax=Xenopus laevis TaxID=8355 RepID=A0A1L8ENW4_XENLA|nr:thrombospondin type-1 domain-containing protein 7B isoform X2 [Xenopus laevis]OCT61032.1 hypothetical protein XELAEV_18047058mg [Xenopus laevis]